MVCSAGKKVDMVLKGKLVGVWRSVIGLKHPWHSMAVLATGVLEIVEHWVFPIGLYMHTHMHI